MAKHLKKKKIGEVFYHLVVIVVVVIIIIIIIIIIKVKYFYQNAQSYVENKQT
jgi:uncharacterized membrane protein YqiK